MVFSLSPLANLFKMSDTSSDNDTQDDASASSDVLIKNIVQDLFCYDTVKRKRILEFYFVKDAIMVTPFMAARGVQEITNIYGVWSNINQIEPTINNIVFDGRTAVIHYVQNICPAVLPTTRYTLRIPAITTLYFKEQEGLIKICKQQDSWTLEGLVEAFPLASVWYTRFIRVLLAKVAAVAGDMYEGSSTWQEHMYSTSQQEQVVLDSASWREFDQQQQEERKKNNNELVDGMILLEDS
ncbi:hypothetical protein BDB00DRAFT_810141 [Zychaea mexicana]|uniref:uncharacterized protein n=1 Tax=Zychaea mexicana TaxID=64656 RepID=UPI0022FE8DE6|nr:uncharacterized protein BDB00DRAFT_810141 [Zychaea mexicana]KAI9496361.1 hypothetical protein BDB00DRAFT_810141 [Zychaea mexicana]